MFPGFATGCDSSPLVFPLLTHCELSFLADGNRLLNISIGITIGCESSSSVRDSPSAERKASTTGLTVQSSCPVPFSFVPVLVSARPPFGRGLLRTRCTWPAPKIFVDVPVIRVGFDAAFGAGDSTDLT